MERRRMDTVESVPLEKLYFEKAKRIALQIDPKVDQYTEYVNGYHFIQKCKMRDISDPGFAVSKSDSKVYYGIGAHQFLQGEIIQKGDF